MRKIKKNLKITTPVILISIIAVALLLNCFSEPENGNEQHWYPNPDTPNKCLANLLYIYNKYTTPNVVYDSPGKYDATLHEEYVFVFDPNDDEVQSTSWNKTEDMNATYNMFNAPINDIDFEISALDGDFDTSDPDSNDIGWNGEDDDFETTLSISFLLMMDEINGYEATGECDFKFLREDGIFYLREWKDHTASS